MLTHQSFLKWVKTVNAGHKRLWIVFTVIWILSFMIPSIYQYYKDTEYCKAAEENTIGMLVGGVSQKTYNICSVKRPSITERSVGLYKISAKFNYFSVLWAGIPPLVLPILVFVSLWIYIGYKQNN